MQTEELNGNIMARISIGNEGRASNISGWYAPGINMHRSPYNSRNYEYYSEDPALTGMIAAYVADGTKSRGVYSYIKHFSLCEPGPNAKNVNTWVTEQTWREIYLKPFEIAVKQADVNGIMTAFNNVGAVWAGASYAQNVEILRNEWGFRGTLVTDWTSGTATMDPHRGVRGGQDIFLCPRANSRPLDENDPTDMYCAKMAAKNVIFTVCNTYWYMMEGYEEGVRADLGYDRVDTATLTQGKDTQDANIGRYTLSADEVEQGSTSITSAWWRPTLISVDVVVAIGLGVWLFFAFKPKKVKQKAE